MRKIPLDRIDQIADQIVALFELHTNAAPGLILEISLPDQPVVDADQPNCGKNSQH